MCYRDDSKKIWKWPSHKKSNLLEAISICKKEGPRGECGKTPGALVSLCFFSLFFLFCYSPSFTAFRENLCWLAQPTACAQEVLNEHLILFLQDRKYYLEVWKQDWLSRSKGSDTNSGHQIIHWNKYPTCRLLSFQKQVILNLWRE